LTQLNEIDMKVFNLELLDVDDSSLSSRLAESAKRIDRMRDVLGNLDKTSASATRSPALETASAAGEIKKDRR
jgi:hypothetical protein